MLHGADSWVDMRLKTGGVERDDSSFRPNRFCPSATTLQPFGNRQLLPPSAFPTTVCNQFEVF